jgi:hypothetical protein
VGCGGYAACIRQKNVRIFQLKKLMEKPTYEIRAKMGR